MSSSDSSTAAVAAGQQGWTNWNQSWDSWNDQGWYSQAAAGKADTHGKGNQGQSAAVAADTDSGWRTRDKGWKKQDWNKCASYKAAPPPAPKQASGKVPPPPPPADAADQRGNETPPPPSAPTNPQPPNPTLTTASLPPPPIITSNPLFRSGGIIIANAVEEERQYRFLFDIGFFRIWKTRNAYRGTYKQHSAALKWLRHVHNPAAVAADSSAAVAADGASEPEPVVLQPYSMQVAQCLHPKGMEYSFDENVMLDWSWLEMVAQLDEDSMFEVVGDGLVRCEFSRRTNSYDHKTHHAMIAAGKVHQGPQLRVWDFVLWRADGSGIRLHPQWSSTRIETFATEGHAEQVQCPSKGLGTSDGRGTYQKYKRGSTQGTLKFDHEKRPLRLAA